MANKIAFRWDSTAEEISFFFYNEDQMTYSPFQCHLINTQAAARGPLRLFEDLINQNTPGEIEYRIVSRNPQSDGDNNPTPLTKYILREFDSICSNHRDWIVNEQVRGELTGKALKKFKKGVINLDVAHRAFQWHLWTIVTHTTNAKVKNTLKKLYAKIKLVSVTTRAGREQFEGWYQQLG